MRQLCDEYNVEFVHSSITQRELIKHKIETEQVVEGPFYVFDFGVIVRQYHQWVTLLPRVKPFYAVKCNPEPAIIKALSAMGAGFDCASQGEITQVLSYGVDPERIVLANPCKMQSHIIAAKNLGVTRMTFDNADELLKIKKCYPNSELILRILPDDSHSVMKFGSKFGATPSTWNSLFKLARDLGLKVMGISFHVGSGCMHAKGFTETLKVARAAFDLGESFGFNLTLLDIGGGFPGNDNTAVTFREIAIAMAPVLDELFPPHVQMIGEPGRYFAADTHLLATIIYARRYIEPTANEVPGASADLRYLYYVNDGVYGAFNCVFFDHAHPTPVTLKEHSADVELHQANVFGPTCDSLDVIVRNHPLPELNVGDWLYWPSMGAYTSAAASAFNGFKTKTVFYVFTI